MFKDQIHKIPGGKINWASKTCGEEEDGVDEVGCSIQRLHIKPVVNRDSWLLYFPSPPLTNPENFVYCSG